MEGKIFRDEILLSLAIGILLLFLVGCSEPAEAPQVRLTGPSHVMVGPDSEEPQVVEIGRLRQVLSQAGYGREATAKALAQAQRQREAYRAGVGRGHHQAEGGSARSQNVLILARVLFSETKSRTIMSYIGSVVRARLVSGRYPDDVQGVVTEDGQFSGYDDPAERRRLARLGYDSQSRDFQRAIRAAWFALNAPRQMLPAEAKATHFIHVDTQRRMGRDIPAWAQLYPEQFRAYDRSGKSEVVFYRHPDA